MRRRVLVAEGVALGSVLAVLILVPLFFGGPIAERVRAGIDGAVAARVDWGGFGLTLFRDFPNPTVRLDDLTVIGVDRFEGDTLAAVGSFRLSLDLGSVVRALRERGP
ncbi:MAG TPA: hypothetical protein VE173_04700, partial [Longimicrobiales bacterium]|nr:hypothetical protein [Longimicrobiales bacterium]